MVLHSGHQRWRSVVIRRQRWRLRLHNVQARRVGDDGILGVVDLGSEVDLLLLLEPLRFAIHVVQRIVRHRLTVVHIQVGREQDRFRMQALLGTLGVGAPSEDVVEQRRSEAAVKQTDMAVELIAHRHNRTVAHDPGLGRGGRGGAGCYRPIYVWSKSIYLTV